jgi:hypothetical protein
LYSSVLLKLTACLLAVLLQFTAILRALIPQLRNSAHLCGRGTDTDLQKTHQVIAIQQSIGAVAEPRENTCHVISKHCCVTSLRMSKLHRNKDNATAVLLAVYVLRALSGNGNTCHNIFNFSYIIIPTEHLRSVLYSVTFIFVSMFHLVQVPSRKL